MTPESTANDNGTLARLVKAAGGYACMAATFKGNGMSWMLAPDALSPYFWQLLWAPPFSLCALVILVALCCCGCCGPKPCLNQLVAEAKAHAHSALALIIQRTVGAYKPCPEGEKAVADARFDKPTEQQIML